MMFPWNKAVLIVLIYHKNGYKDNVNDIAIIKLQGTYQISLDALIVFIIEKKASLGFGFIIQ